MQMRPRSPFQKPIMAALLLRIRAASQIPLSRGSFQHVKYSSTMRRVMKDSRFKDFWKQAKGKATDVPSFRQLTIEVTNNHATPDPEFFTCLTPLRPTKPSWDVEWMSYSRRHQPFEYKSLVILFTPDFLPWFNDNTFIPKILDRISHSSSSVTDEVSPVQVKYRVVCACVDGIAPEESYGTFKGQPVTKGFSFLHAPVKTLIGQRRKAIEDESSQAAIPTPAVVLFARGGPETQGVAVPLANTMFQNGKASVLESSVWGAEEGKFVEIIKKEDMRFVYIHALTGINRFMESFIPACPVTPFHTIKDGFGNIVRTLDFGSDDVGPASQELEKVVSTISDRLGGSKVDVWALIVPPGVADAEAGNLPEPGPEYIGFWLRRGGKMCRVVSGGGGWGPKQGLLSLDPETRLPRPASELEDKPLETMDEDMISGLGNIAETGASIQFLVVDDGLPPPLPMGRKRFTSTRKSIVFGSIPSTIDDIPETNDSLQETRYQYRVGHFGCVSGSGIFFQHGNPSSKTTSTSERGLEVEGAPEPEKASGTTQQAERKEPTFVRTKIDLPYSYMYFDQRIMSQRNAGKAAAMVFEKRKSPMNAPAEHYKILKPSKFSARIYHGVEEENTGSMQGTDPPR
ncbi:uncharacterized protein LY89DRAFT_714581 [Mollisia scopiformis]|uniref:Uncharacterized protein n=1 Tax=Mollisia scopiformis TaxID=149040 RepID=A0A194XRU9_MOLSC|nr:uncharacterized protein LY89DRAFT_714581 [Mollisia scopiformis]KUJ22876.1 hypothetical protein LY89DRAFT_714581 [Mollisia scopiformis]